MIKFYVDVDAENGLKLGASGTGEEIAKTIALGIAFFEAKNRLGNVLMDAVNDAYEAISEDMKKALIEGGGINVPNARNGSFSPKTTLSPP